MRRPSTWMALALLGLVLPGLTACGGDRPERKKRKYMDRGTAAADSAEQGEGAVDEAGFGATGTVDPAKPGVITGVIKFKGSAPAPRKIDMSAKDQWCGSQHTVYSEELVVGPEGGLKDVFVHIEAGMRNKGYPVPSEAAKLIQDGCRYIPHVLPLFAGQKLDIVNNDDTTHNYHFISRKNGEINKTQSGPMTNTESLRNVEIGANFKCDVHPWMRTNVHIVDHPFFAVTDESGRFEIKNVPPGKYRLGFVHERKLKLDPVVIEIGAETKDLGEIAVN